MNWTKATVVSSTVAALAFETINAGHDISELPTVALVAAVGAYAAGRRHPDRTAGTVMAVGYLVPAIFFLLHGHFRLWYLTPWKCALVGAMGATLQVKWQWPERFRFAFVAWALAVALTWPIVALRELDWTPSLLWVRPATPSSAVHNVATTAVWIAQIAQIHLLGLLWVDWAFGRFAPNAADRFERLIVRPLFGSAFVAALLAVYQGFVDLRFLSLGTWADIGRAAGALADANPSGALTALWVGIPLGIAATARRPKDLLGAHARRSKEAARHDPSGACKKRRIWCARS